jgi:DNA polymerase-1
MRKRFFVIDGHNLAYRAFYALPSLSNSRGQITNAVLGFANTLYKILKEEKPDLLAVTFDSPTPTHRHKEYKEYKATRKEMPEEMKGQLPLIKEVLGAFNIPVLEKEGYEADDLMGALAKRGEKDYEMVFFTGDKDILQLVSPRVKVMAPQRGLSGEAIFYDEKEVERRWGIKPEEVPEMMGLAGDTSDNIPGVPGIGEKTALELIKEFKSLENLFNNLDKVKREKRRDSLRKFREKAFLSRKLATLKTDFSLDIDFSQCEVKEFDREKLKKVFQELEFRRLLKEVAVEESRLGKYEALFEEKDFLKLLKDLGKAPGFTIDLETTDKNPLLAEIVGIAISLKPGEALYIPLGHKNLSADRQDPSSGKQLDLAYVLKELKPLLENERIGKYGQNLKYEIVVFRRYGIELKGIAFDTMIASYLLNPSKPTHNLEEIAFEYLNHKMIPIDSLIGKGKKQIKMSEVEVEKVIPYACEDADITFRLKEVLSPKLEEKGLVKLFSEIEMPLVKVLAEMEMEGVKIDTKHLEGLSRMMGEDISKLEKEVYSLAGQEFNLNSPKQLSFILFEKFQLPRGRKIKTGYSTGIELLERLSMYELPARVLEYRQLAKLKSTYTDALTQMVNPQTGRVHTSFNQTVTATGRLSSSDPNLQNIPVRTEIGREIRKAFIPEKENYLLLSADYSQVELRLLAHLSGDPNLREAFSRDEDIHTINKYFDKYKGVKEYIEKTLEEARKRKYVTTLLGRRRYLPDIKSKSYNLRAFAERTAINAPLQGTAADLIKKAMIEISRKLKEKSLKTKMTLQVHDELLFEVPEQELEEAKSLVQKEMSGALSLNVPLKVDLKTGKNWAEVN